MFIYIFGQRFYIHHGRSVARVCHLLGLVSPAIASDMVQRGETPEYIAAAILAVNSFGE